MNADSNPFSTKHWTPGAIPYVFDESDDSLEKLLNTFWATPNRIAQIVGPHGSGKTTLLRSLNRELLDRGFTVNQATLNDRQRFLPRDVTSKAGDAETVFILDGYEQLSLAHRYRLRSLFRNREAGLIWTSHRPALFVPVLYRTVPRFKRFQELVGGLLANTSYSFDGEALDEIFRRENGNFRSAFFELYDRIQDIDMKGVMP